MGTSSLLSLCILIDCVSFAVSNIAAPLRDDRRSGRRGSATFRFKEKFGEFSSCVFSGDIIIIR